MNQILRQTAIMSVCFFAFQAFFIVPLCKIMNFIFVI